MSGVEYVMRVSAGAAVDYLLDQLADVPVTDITHRPRPQSWQYLLADDALDHMATALGLELACKEPLGDACNRIALLAQCRGALAHGLYRGVAALSQQREPLARLLASLGQSQGGVLAERSTGRIRAAGIAGKQGKRL